MAIISNVRVRGLRSVANQRLDGLHGLSVLVGRNSSGKSNILRALSLFFADEVEPGLLFDPVEDFYYRQGSNRRREVEIAIDFDLPPEFKFRVGAEEVKNTLGLQFSIHRIWNLDRQRNVVSRSEVHWSDGSSSNDHAPVIDQFLSMINFRYIQNRTQPSELLALESRRLAGLLVRRIRQTKDAEAFLGALQKTAGRFLKPASDAMAESGAPLENIEVATARALGEMLQVAGLRATGRHGGSVDDERWGAGHQALGLFEVLRLVDTDYSAHFGWKQATVWAVEEPESGLHQELQTYLAGRFSDWTSDPWAKHQVIMSTHSPVFTMAADCGYWVEMSPDGSTSVTQQPIHELVRDAEHRNVSPWTQPLLAYPNSVVVLVEGDIDADVLQHMAALKGTVGVRFLPLPRLDPAAKRGGVDSIIGYLKHFSGLIPNRPKSAPFLVLLDWEVEEQKVGQARQAYGAGGAARVLVGDPTLADPRMTDDFAGIERFYPPSVWEDAEGAGEVKLLRTKGSDELGIRVSQLRAAKSAVRSRVLDLDSASDAPSLAALVDQVLAAV
ncbi:MAG: AAA family ATPase [Dehalococcoidia bacterium]